jgi:hypothetical protein
MNSSTRLTRLFTIPFVVIVQSGVFDGYLEIVSVANENLGERVGSLAAEGDAIIAALDELITRAFG